ncbi:MAG: hypothetical protein ACYSTI_04165 [Planctomycetota bacterium]
MSRRRSFHSAKRFVLGKQIPFLLALLCVTLFVSLCSITTPTLAAPVVGWAATYGGDNTEEAHSIQQTTDGGYIVVGSMEHTAGGDEGNSDILVSKPRPDGTIDPSCDLTRDTTGILAANTNTVIKGSSSDIRDSNVIPQGSSTTVQDTHASANILCTSTAGE